MKIVIFDLDGTLLPMDMDVFTKAYFGAIGKKLAGHGYEPKSLVDNVLKGTYLMVKNDGRDTNENVFWEFFKDVYGERADSDKALFDEFYEKDFDSLRSYCGFNELAAKTIEEIKKLGLRVAIATNPVFPPIASETRARWSGVDPSDFEFITTYDNSRFCKPNLGYYKDVLNMLDAKAEDCLMVGNDVGDDMVAKDIGMDVFLLTDCLINSKNADISGYPQGGFPELMEYIRNNCSK